ncbi:unnamed protein product [Didymodactylos carnosus]|uniref:sterol 22-desaturase n=1 Tax=Didymodactylos carnosus TaxID=1234261 RepID=A0A8S2ESQ5_9BILA|nr:unnamed protein product [Didymodactylos carnosus]CAF4070461.1 unnamed protein product [Didymodactylos carnosus]
MLTLIENFPITTGLTLIIMLLLTAILYEQITFIYKRSSLPGPPLVIPFFGSIFQMVGNPYNFWHKQMSYGALSWNSIVGQFVVMVTDGHLARQIFEQCSEKMPLMLNPNAHRLLGKDNIAFINGPVHKKLRSTLLPLFTTKALTIYLNIQEKAIREHIKYWLELSRNTDPNTGFEMRQLIYDLNLNTSLSVFLGSYIDDCSRKQFKYDYQRITQAMYAFPFFLPGTKLWQGCKARRSILNNLKSIVNASKTRIQDQKEEPTCLLDFWMLSLLNQDEENKHKTDEDIAKVTLDFIFASQDASTSSLTFSVHELSQNPNVLEKLRTEQNLLRGNNKSGLITPDLLTNMKYTWQVMREILRLRPPATIVPHMTNVSYKINSEYTIPAGTIVVPSIWSSNRHGFSNPDLFDPERFNSERNEHSLFEKQFLTFGCGPHACIGQRYAQNHIMLFLSILSDYQFERQNTSNKDEIIYLPTIYPADGCKLRYLREI